MITTTALVLLTMTATVQPVSPTVTPTYTAGELKAFNHGVDKGIMEQYCFVTCSMLKIEIKHRTNELKRKRPLNPDDPSDTVGDKMLSEEMDRVQDKLYGDDRYGSKKSIRDSKALLKKNGCDCSKFKDKK